MVSCPAFVQTKDTHRDQHARCWSRYVQTQPESLFPFDALSAKHFIYYYLLLLVLSKDLCSIPLSTLRPTPITSINAIMLMIFHMVYSE